MSRPGQNMSEPAAVIVLLILLAAMIGTCSLYIGAP